MKSSILVAIGALCIAVVSAAVLIRAGKPPDVSIVMGPKGLASLKVNDTEFLEDGEFKVEHVLLKKSDGATYDGANTASPELDQARQTLTEKFPWGLVKVAYHGAKNRMTLTVTTTNTSKTETIQSVNYIPLTVRFPERLKEYDGSTPLLAHNIGQIAAIKASYGSGSVAIVDEDVARPLMVGFPWAANRPTSSKFPLSIHTGRVNSYPDSYPTIVRPIAATESDTYVVTLRFGRPDATDSELYGDVYKKFADAFPPKTVWTDRRPIGAIFLASNLPERPPTNPRGWFGDTNLNVKTPSGQSEFRTRLLAMADESIRIMGSMNAQGAITWDPEGQEFAHSTSYIGDPRLVDTLAPEMSQVIDEYFGRFIKAGFRTGICIRPQLLQVSADGKLASQTSVVDPAQLLIDKIRYATKRWGVTLIYLDSNTNGTDPNPTDADVIEKVTETFPDVLLIPEHSNLRYYAYSIPYLELRSGRIRTSDSVRATYPNASSLIYTADGPLDLYHAKLAEAVKHGDILMYRTWWPDPQNEKVKAFYKK